jgi:hypothetical protein
MSHYDYPVHECEREVSADTEIDAHGVAYLDHTPACGFRKRHNSAPPSATHWVDLHGCDDRLICGGCLKWLAAAFQARAALFGQTHCEMCGKPSIRFSDCYRVVPL